MSNVNVNMKNSNTKPRRTMDTLSAAERDSLGSHQTITMTRLLRSTLQTADKFGIDREDAVSAAGEVLLKLYRCVDFNAMDIQEFSEERLAQKFPAEYTLPGGV